MAHLVYDGDCRLCQANVGWLERHDKTGRLDARPSSTESEDLAAHGLTARADETLLWRDGERTHVESAAVVRSLWSLGGLPRLYGGLLWLVPAPLRNAGYRWVARRRHRWNDHKID